MKKNKKSSLKNMLSWFLPIVIVVSIIGLFIIYKIFSGPSVIRAGINLTRADWLAFIGSYLSFIGTAAVSFIALWQTKHYNETENARRDDERLKAVQPIFSVKIEQKRIPVTNSSNHTITADPVNYFEIENANTHPITNVIIFDNYQKIMLKSGEPLILKCVFYDHPQVHFIKDVNILFHDYDRNAANMPLSFNINYEDIDGRTMFQTFELKDFNGKKYYSLEGTYEA